MTAAEELRSVEDALRQTEGYRGSEQRNLVSLRGQLDQEKDQLGHDRSKRISLEKRLEDVRNILRTMNTAVEGTIEEANRTVGRAEERYLSAVRCVGVASASIQAAYRTKTVEDDNDTAAACQLCRIEENRLVNDIAELQARISEIESAIGVLNSQIFNAEENVKTYSWQISRYKDYIFSITGRL